METRSAEKLSLIRARKRDPSFVYAVRSTGIYCRSHCPSRQPRAENVLFFASPAHAEQAGYRACKRCRPKDAEPEGARLVRRACALLHADCRRSVAALCEELECSPSRLQRSFRRCLGVSPKQYAQTLRGREIRDALRSAHSVGAAQIDSGFSSTGRFHEAGVDAMGMSPSAFRKQAKGEQLFVAIAPSSLGLALVVQSKRGVCAVELSDDAAELEQKLQASFGNAELIREHPAYQSRVEEVLAEIEIPGSHVLPLDMRGTAFQRRVWTVLAKTKPGDRLSYREIAGELGMKSASRAVGNACAKNRLAVLIPCHRAVRSDGGLGGYRWGLDRKRKLLDRERSDSEA